MSSTAPPFMETRAGGRCTAPDVRSREPTKPNFHASLRQAALDETRCGSGRRGGSGLERPQRVRGAKEEDIGTIGQVHQRDDTLRSDVVDPARFFFEHAGQKEPGVGGARLAHGARQVVAQCALANPEMAHERLVGPGVHAGDDDLVDLVTGQADVLQSPFPRLPPEGQVAGLAEPLLPELRALLARNAPSIQEFVGRRARTEPLGDDVTAGPSSPTRMAAPASPPMDSSPLVARPLRVSAETTRTAPALVSAAWSAPAPERNAPPKSNAGTALGSRRAAWRTVALVLSR
jgi:hypothetical protein